MIGTSAIFARFLTLSLSSRAPNEQFSPTANGLACFIEIQNASIVCPERFLPERSVAVHERMRAVLPDFFDKIHPLQVLLL